MVKQQASQQCSLSSRPDHEIEQNDENPESDGNIQPNKRNMVIIDSLDVRGNMITSYNNQTKQQLNCCFSVLLCGGLVHRNSVIFGNRLHISFAMNVPFILQFV